ncbi:MAG: PIN domain nuclease [Elusimicrobia bacterium]|nr:PIN domain nuclease [Candidatus Liberimonas magnetica]
MKKLKLYLDTSILNFAISDRENLELQIMSTKDIIGCIKRGDYEGYISDEVLKEIEQAPKDIKELLFQVVKGTGLGLLKADKDTEILAEKYIEEGLIPLKYRDDALHIAVATVNGMDIVMSWNFEHMVKLKTKKGVIAVNELMGYKTIEILTPQEVD